jgi:tetratricopeptide (TPR) repeat protein
MKKSIFLYMVLIYSCGMMFAADPAATLQEGNLHYTEARYEEAVAAYESIIDSGYVSAELYYNLGNAYFKSHNITMALVNYERARILDPDDEELLHNLAIAREFVVDRIEVLPEFFLRAWFRDFIRILDIDAWALLSVISFIASLGFLLLYFLAARISLRRMGFWLGIFLIIVSLSGLFIGYQSRNLVMNHNRAIILTPSVTIKSSPDEQSGTDLFLLHEGTLVTVEDELGEWREVVLTDGNRGWLRETDLVRI